MTRMSPAMTAPGLLKALPSVSDRETPVPVGSVILSQAGANVTATPMAATTSAAMTPVSGPSGRRGQSAGHRPKATTEPAAHAAQPMRLSTRPAPSKLAPSAIGKPASARKRPSVTTLRPVAISAPVRCSRAATEDEHRARRPAGQVDQVRPEVRGLRGQARPAVGREQADHAEHDAGREQRGREQCAAAAELWRRCCGAGCCGAGRPSGRLRLERGCPGGVRRAWVAGASAAGTRGRGSRGLGGRRREERRRPLAGGRRRVSPLARRRRGGHRDVVRRTRGSRGCRVGGTSPGRASPGRNCPADRGNRPWHLERGEPVPGGRPALWCRVPPLQWQRFLVSRAPDPVAIGPLA